MRNAIDSLRQQIERHGPLAAEVRRKVDYKFRLDWNYYSNSMEGNTLTMDETRSVMVGNLTVGGKPIKDVLEMRGHDIIVSEVLRIGRGEARLSEARIKEIHRGIMHEDDPEKQRKIGIWKPEANYMLNYKGERFEFVPPDEVPERMHDLLNRTNAALDAIFSGKKNATHPVDVALQFHLDFVAIHPFYDGNGRTARILTNLLLISCGYPPFWVKTGEREAYGRYLGDIQGYGGTPDLFFSFIGKLILRSQQLMLDAIEGREIEDDDDLVKRVSLLKGRLLIDGNEPFTIEWNEENAAGICDQIIVPVFETIESAIAPTELLFKNRYFEYAANGRAFSNISDAVDSIHSGSSEVWQHIYSKGLRSENHNEFNVNVGCRIVLHQFVFEVFDLDGNMFFSLPYHRPPNEVELKSIGKAVSNALVTAIEARLDSDRS